MTARHHHYLSQCYLKGFTNGGGKKSKLIVIDVLEKRHFETIPRNVGGVRDFNRIEADGVDPNVLEDALAKFEWAAATALREIGEGASFDGESRILVLNLVALFAIRSPEMREHWRKFRADIAERIMDLALASKERWESQVRRMKEAGIEVNDAVTYEDIKKFHEGKKYTFEVATEHHIRMEFVGIEAILPYLNQRKWLLVRSTEESGPFITTDNPVNLTWREPGKVPPLFRDSPGYGMKDTQVYFPLSRSMALIGEFDGHEGEVTGTRELISLLNTRMLMFAYKQVYAPKLTFWFQGGAHELVEGKHLLSYLSR